MSLIFIDSGIYRDSRTDNLYHRPIIGGRRTARKLNSTTLTMARKEVAALKTRQLEARIGLQLDPYATLLTIGELAKEWLLHDCLDRRGRRRLGQNLEAESARLKRLLPFWKDKEARLITSEDCRDYSVWRRKNGKNLGATIDRELQTLSNLFTWAAQRGRKTGIHHNPLAHRPRFDDLGAVRHCTAVMPLNDETLHKYAVWLLGYSKSRASGWQLLLEALTGARTSEILKCRTDAKQARKPGHQDGHALHLDRLKKGIEPWALLEVIPGHAPLADLLSAFRAWHNERYPHSPWFIPSLFNPDKPADRHALTRALDRASKILDLPKITSHGCRAYFVRTLRSLGVDDSEIAKRLGHRSGIKMVEQIYGISEPGWFGSRKMDFLPDGFAPAWSQWVPRKSRKIVQLKDRSTDSAAAGSSARLCRPIQRLEKR